MRTPSPVDVGDLIDNGPWTTYQRWLVVFAALAIIFDGIDNQLLGVAIPTIMREWAVPRSAFAPVVSLGYVGMMIGGALGGIAGDRAGRRTTLLASMAVFGVMTLAVGLADSVVALAVMRLIAGVGLGGAIPNAAALAAEYVPRHARPLAVTLTIVCVPLGGMLAGLIAIPAIPALGWRALFVIGGVLPMVALVVLAPLLPESPRFLARHPERHAQLASALRRMGCAFDEGTTFTDRAAGHAGHRASARALFSPEYRVDSSALWAAFFSCLLAVYLSFSWVPSMLAGAGFSSSVASSGLTAFNLGGVMGALAGGICMSRWGSRPSLLVMAVLATMSAGVMSAMPISAASPAPVIVMLGLTGALINGVQTTMYALAAHVYPPAIRSTGVGSAVAFGRVGAVLSGYVGAWALEFRGATSFFAIIAATMLACTLALALVGRHSLGRE
jgi:AAHS family 4-hydroxybenzoate transporter-like MFS transporter